MKFTTFSKILTVFLVLILSNSAFACDLHAVCSPIDINKGAKDTFQLGISHQFTHFESNLRPEGFEKFPGQHLESNITQIFGIYNLSERLSLQSNLPLIFRDYQRIKNSQLEKSSENGIGDISLLAKYSMFRAHQDNSTVIWEILGGVKLATGDSDRLKEEQDAFRESHARHSGEEGNLVGGDHLALGSGSYDFILGTAIFYQLDDFYFNGNLHYTLRQEGDFDYEFGNGVQWDLGPAYYVSRTETGAFSTRIKLSGDYKSADKISGQSLTNSADKNIYLGPEIWYARGNDWSLKLGLDIPVETNSSAEEVVPKYRVLSTFTASF
ncbi:MAG: hypothetical protein R3A13_12030 [Bdellovibrionota bacterium]